MPQDEPVRAGRMSVDAGATNGAPSEVTVSATADVAASARLGSGTRVWHLAQVGEQATIGRSCVLGRGAYVGPGVVVGNHVKIQNYALVYHPATLGDGVFVGPAAVLTNDLNPRAVDVDGRPKAAANWAPVAVHVGEGASLGAQSVCVAPVTVGRWAMVGAGAVVVADVPDFALVVGVPARRVGWVGRAGFPLRRVDDGTGPDEMGHDGLGREVTWQCDRTGDRYTEKEGILHEHRP